MANTPKGSTDTSPGLQKELAAYEEIRDWLETDHFGQWVVVFNAELVDTFESFQDAASEAVQRFGRGPYLIRQVGEPPITLPASVLYQPVLGRHVEG